MTSLQKFESRAKDVRKFLRSVQDLEKKYTLGSYGFYAATRTIACSRASAFIMMYNCIEFSFRESLKDIRIDVVNKNVEFNSLNTYWMKDILRGKFLDALSQGTNFERHIEKVVEFFPGTVGWEKLEDAPFSGGVDAAALIRLSKNMGSKFKVPVGTLGGEDLNLIKKTRNDLAHGAETFIDIGNTYTTQDIIDKFERMRKFMRSFLMYMYRYKDSQKYFR